MTKINGQVKNKTNLTIKHLKVKKNHPIQFFKQSTKWDINSLLYKTMWEKRDKKIVNVYLKVCQPNRTENSELLCLDKKKITVLVSPVNNLETGEKVALCLIITNSPNLNFL